MLQKVRMCSICGFEGICICFVYATVAQLVEYDLAKVGVAGSSPVSRSYFLLVESRVSGIMGILFCLHKKTLLKFFAKVFAFLYVTTRYIF